MDSGLGNSYWQPMSACHPVIRSKGLTLSFFHAEGASCFSLVCRSIVKVSTVCGAPIEAGSFVM